MQFSKTFIPYPPAPPDRPCRRASLCSTSLDNEMWKLSDSGRYADSMMQPAAPPLKYHSEVE